MSELEEFDDYVEEPRKRGALARVLISLFTIGVLGIILIAGTLVYAQIQMTGKGPLKSTKIVTVKRGMGTGDIAEMLAKENAIANPGIFMAATLVYRRSRGTLKAGEFEIPAGANMSEILRLLQAGKSLVYKVTIPEGWTTQNAFARIAANEVLKGELSLQPTEGSLLPDTYVFQRGTTRDQLVKRMQDAQKKLLNELWTKRASPLPIKTRAEALILASIVERETGVSVERAHVAAVFINRINKKMRLQSDPTIIYGIVGGKGKMDRPLSTKDIATKTAFNTYQIDGLPPTPIANPGRKAIAAVLNPAKSDDLYFVADGTGGHAFAKTYEGHKENVAKWRKIERQRKLENAAAAKSDKITPKATTKKPDTAKPAGKKPKTVDPKNSATTSDGKTIALPPVKPAN